VKNYAIAFLVGAIAFKPAAADEPSRKKEEFTSVALLRRDRDCCLPKPEFC